jgi:hypothetical protein
VAAQAGELLPQPVGGHAFEAVDQAGDGDGGREVHQQVHKLGLAAELGQFRPKDCAHIPHDLLHPFQVPRGEYRVPVLRDETKWTCTLNTVPKTPCLPVLMSPKTAMKSNML